ncbi:ATP-binding protein [Streptomyces sp. JH34]|uniref:ATP-binding protein n=1 Tax=Streptomyces sp. JH34 TaxID=2793633 RepID=UPI0023F7FE9D|nr:ATP-binding protein [Streptomyces sp. JH34]
MPRLPRGVPVARHRVQEAMRDWGEPDERVETAALVVTELVANAVEHTAGRRIRCRLLRTSGRVRICVWNRGRLHVPDLPGPRKPEPSDAPPGGPFGSEGPGPVASGGPDGTGDGFDLASVAEGGRGLMLVDALATRWGTGTSVSGRLVWADV